jgi:hypothetical protein
MPRGQRTPIETGLALDVFAQSSDANRRRVPAWLLSALLHGAILILCAVITPVPSGGITVEPLRSGGIVLVQQTGSDAKYFDEQDHAQAASAAQSAATDSADAARSPADMLPSATDLPVDPSAVLPSADAPGGLGVGADVAAALPAAGDLTAGVGPDRQLGKGTQTYVFGAKGEGSIFIYVFDRSDSMNGFEGRPLAASKAELTKSLQSLQAIHQFQIIFYNAQVTAFNPSPSQPPKVMFATEQNKTLAAQFVRHVPAYNGTRHMEPLRLALRLAPDVIFFLTDAGEPQLSAADLESLQRLNSGTVIHTIEFGAGPDPGGDNFLARLARQNDGQHVYVDVTRLPGM